MERHLRAREAQWVVLALARGELTIGLILGVLIIIGGRERWSSPSFQTALHFPYAPESWGYALGALSLVGLVCSLFGLLRGVAVALYVSAVWALFFCWSLYDSAWANPDAATTGVPVYFGYAMGSIVLGLAHWRSSRDALHR